MFARVCNQHFFFAQGYERHWEPRIRHRLCARANRIEGECWPGDAIVAIYDKHQIERLVVQILCSQGLTSSALEDALTRRIPHVRWGEINSALGAWIKSLDRGEVAATPELL
jgi:hypothetical protein